VVEAGGHLRVAASRRLTGSSFNPWRTIWRRMKISGGGATRFGRVGQKDPNVLVLPLAQSVILVVLYCFLAHVLSAEARIRALGQGPTTDARKLLEMASRQREAEAELYALVEGDPTLAAIMTRFRATRPTLERVYRACVVRGAGQALNEGSDWRWDGS